MMKVLRESFFVTMSQLLEIVNDRVFKLYFLGM